MTDHSNNTPGDTHHPRPDSCRQGSPIPGVHFYFTEDGLLVMTERYLRERGYCCKNGCRHCPYGFDPDRPIPNDKSEDTAP